MLKNKNIVLGVTGGIAVYKACDLVSRLRKKGASVDVIMTKSACEFVAPLTFQTLSNNYVVTDMFKEPKTWEVEHIELAKKADLFLIVPATANFIGKTACGIADDMLTTTVMATTAQVMIAPAMNTNMYLNPIVQGNIEKLKSLGYRFVEPATGKLACGDTGVGKLADVDDIMDEVEDFFADMDTEKDLEGINIVITAGPTVEDIDPVRFISNRSTGKMGYAIAERAVKRGADVTLVSGQTLLRAPKGLKKFYSIKTTEDVYEILSKEIAKNDIIIQSAALADYRPKHYSEVKIKKTDGDMNIELERNRDVAFELGKIKGDEVLVGFAAETNDVVENAARKVKKKNLDFIVANDLTKSGAGFSSDTNIVKIIDSDGNITEYDKMPKTEVADIILSKSKDIFLKRKK